MKAAGEEGMEGVSAFEAYVHRAFAPDGLFSRARDFEYRAEQQSMALAVARALQVDAPLLVEAGTGVGKSLGYLLPAVKFALDFDRKAVISTHTINLQEQLFNKDIPLLRTALGIDFSAALLKGRQNYLCHTRLRISPKNRVWLSTTTLASRTRLRAAWYGQEGPQWRMLHACGSLQTMAHTLEDGRNAISLRVPSCVLRAQSWILFNSAASPCVKRESICASARRRRVWHR